ncbi:MAG: hypothetical protein JG762_837 [Deferribacteraceae bacterium]|jgi:hypothetical protein|nr:hypothetical protein [Deferribacteraceae bacterium]
MKKYFSLALFLILLSINTAFASDYYNAFNISPEVKMKLEKKIYDKVIRVNKVKNGYDVVLNSYITLHIDDSAILTSSNFEPLPLNIIGATTKLKYLNTDGKLIIQIIEVRK